MNARNTTAPATYSINVIDSDTPPAWLDLCTSATPGAQDGGRCRWTVTTERARELEAALGSDESVIRFHQVVASAPRCPQCGARMVDGICDDYCLQNEIQRRLLAGESVEQVAMAMGLSVQSDVHGVAMVAMPGWVAGHGGWSSVYYPAATGRGDVARDYAARWAANNGSAPDSVYTWRRGYRLDEAGQAIACETSREAQ